MSHKETNLNVPDTDQGDLPQVPPPSYDSNVNSTQYAPPSGQPESFYQAQPVSGSNSGPYQYPQQQQQTYAAPPAGPYAPPPTGGFVPPQRPPGRAQTVVYVVDDPVASNIEHPGMPIAMICFIFGLCTWVGYLFGMCFIASPDPRERWWARMCCIMCIIWALIIIFASIFGRQ